MVQLAREGAPPPTRAGRRNSIQSRTANQGFVVGWRLDHDQVHAGGIQIMQRGKQLAPESGWRARRDAGRAGRLMLGG